MGKTIKVIFFNDAKDTLSREYQYAKRAAEIKEKLSDASEDTVQDALDKLAIECGVNIFGEDPKTKDYFELRSEINPDHEFKIGAWSLDDSSMGLDYVLNSYDIKNVFDSLNTSLTKVDPELDGYKVDWKKALVNISKVLTEFRGKLNKEDNEYFGMYPQPFITCMKDQGVSVSSINALALTASERTRFPKNHSNEDGMFFSRKPKEVHAVINGIYGEQKCVYLIYYQNLTWYVQALEVIKETIDIISRLSKDKQNKAHLIFV